MKTRRRVGLGTAAVLACGALTGSLLIAGLGTAGAGVSAPSTVFKTARINGLGTVLVDGRGRTVYILTANNRTNVPCTDTTGCTKVWPDLPLPVGVKGAKAGPGVQQRLLGTKKLSDGETYPTYRGWLLYEFSGDSGPGQASGEGVKTFGGGWYVLRPNGIPIDRD